MKHFLSLGAGVQSSTLALLAAAGGYGPMPEAAIFADTADTAFAKILECENIRLREVLAKIVNDLQGLAMAEHGTIGMAVNYAPSIPDAIGILANAGDVPRAEKKD